MSWSTEGSVGVVSTENEIKLTREQIEGILNNKWISTDVFENSPEALLLGRCRNAFVGNLASDV